MEANRNTEARERMQTAYRIAARYEARAEAFACDRLKAKVVVHHSPGPELLRFLNLRALEVHTKLPLEEILRIMFELCEGQIAAVQNATGRIALPWRGMLGPENVRRVAKLAQREFPDALRAWKASQRMQIIVDELQELTSASDPFDFGRVYRRHLLRLRRVLREETWANRHPYRDNPWAD